MAQPVPRNPLLSANRTEVQRFLKTRYGGASGLFQVCSGPRNWTGCFFNADTVGIAKATDYVMELDAGGAESIYSRVTTVDRTPGQGERGGADDSFDFFGPWDDLDFGTEGHKVKDGEKNPPDAETAHQVYKATGLPPASILVNSGGGLYHHVLLKEPVDITDPETRERVESLSRCWQAHIEKTARGMGFSYGRGVANMDRLLRIPGTVNRKPGTTPRMAQVRYFPHRYTLEELEAALPVPQGKPQTPSGRRGGGVRDQDSTGRLKELLRGVQRGATVQEDLPVLVDAFRTNYQRDGGRNNALYILAGAAFQYAAEGQLDFDLVHDSFESAAYELKMDEDGTDSIEKTLKSAEAYGRNNPRMWVDRNSQGEPDFSDRPYGLLPETFWGSRPVLQHIRQSAHAALCSADVTLYTVLARLSAMVDHTIKAETGIKRLASLNLYVAVVGKAGANKSSSISGAKTLSPPPDRDFKDGIPLGTGEGISEAFMGERKVVLAEMNEKTGKPKEETIRTQVLHNAFFTVDEGEIFLTLKERAGAVLGEEIRSAWSGQTLGQTNATKERTRYVSEGSYALGLVAGFQPSVALPVIRDSSTGTAQRFVWVQAVDPNVPDYDNRIADPGPLQVYPQQMVGPKAIPFPDSVKREIYTHQVQRARGEVDIDPLDAHAHLIRVKLSTLLALLEARDYVTESDWGLSEVMWDASRELRSALLESAKREQVAEENEKRSKVLELEADKRRVVGDVDRNIEARARWIWKKVTEGKRRGELNELAASKHRRYLTPGVDLALSRDWITEDDDGELQPGAARPGA
ncbi:hypothetical protein ACWEQ3_30250 [Streptomyces mirabilis]